MDPEAAHRLPAGAILRHGRGIGAANVGDEVPEAVFVIVERIEHVPHEIQVSVVEAEGVVAAEPAGLGAVGPVLDTLSSDADARGGGEPLAEAEFRSREDPSEAGSVEHGVHAAACLDEPVVPEQVAVGLLGGDAVGRCLEGAGEDGRNDDQNSFHGIIE